MKTINVLSFPKKYFPFCSEDDTVPLSEKEKLSKVLTAQIKLSGYFSENIVDSFYNEALKLGEVFSVRMPDPLLRWHPAKQGTTSKFHGHLNKIFPELEKISDETLDALVEEMRDRRK